MQGKRSVGPARPGDASASVDAREASERMRLAEEREYEAMKRERAGADESDNNNKSSNKQREQWMLALPEGRRQDALQYFRGGKTQFAASGQHDVDEQWAAAPGQQRDAKSEEKKALQEAQAAMEQHKAKNVSAMVADYNAQHRPKTLIELHNEKMKGKDDESSSSSSSSRSDDSDSDDNDTKKKRKRKDKKKSKKKKSKKKSKKSKKKKSKKDDERCVDTPTLGGLQVGVWNRDKNMQGSILSAEQKTSMMKSAGNLGGRFSTGNV